jgi:hypothetical protein
MDITRSETTLSGPGLFQRVEEILGITIDADGRDPADETSYVIPAGTPMCPVHTGSDHTDGFWLPIRRTRVKTVAAALTPTVMTVDDASPFAVGDTVQAIDVTGPATGAVTNLGAITAIDYDTDEITVTEDADGLNVDDWIEVTENGSVAAADWYRGRVVGLLLNPVDVRINCDDTDGQATGGVVVIKGTIHEGDINFPVEATNDQVLIWQLSQWLPGGGITIIHPRPHGDELVALVGTP